ncbi:MAG: glucan endo-1,6-beta-glucosidase, partial [Nocardioidaceae bacterium]
MPVEVRRSGKAEASRIVVDTDKEYQRIDGFGAGMTHSSAEVIAAMPPDRRDALIHELFDPDGPVRLSYLRVPIGASDFVSGEAFTHDD